PPTMQQRVSSVTVIGWCWSRHSGEHAKSSDTLASARFPPAVGPRSMVVELRGRTAWPRHHFAAAVRTDAAEHAVGARGAERALERADPCFRGIGRQVLVTAFTTGTQGEHGGIPDESGRNDDGRMVAERTACRKSGEDDGARRSGPALRRWRRFSDPKRARTAWSVPQAR